jgi:predicted DNA-binding protein YlxM (UPF0122 family)
MSAENAISSQACQQNERRVLDIELVYEAKLWAFRREGQRRDIESVRSGRCTPEQMNSFSREKARSMRLIDCPY